MCSGPNCSTYSKLNNKFFLDNQIRQVLPDQRVYTSRDRNLPRYSSTTLDQLLRRRSPVHFPQGFTSEGVRDFVSCPNNVLD